MVPELLRHRAQRVRANFIERVPSPGDVSSTSGTGLVGGHAEYFKILAESQTGVTALEENVSSDESTQPPATTKVQRIESVEPSSPPSGRDAVRRHTKSMNLLAELLGDEGDTDEGAGLPMSGLQPGLNLDDVVEDSLEGDRSAFDRRIRAVRVGARRRGQS